VPDAPPVAEYARQFVQRLRAATDIDTMTNRETARTLGFSRTALMRVLRGEGLPSTSMVATLEQRLGVDLWPGGTAIRAQLDQR
jgi:transcriptional regulator with XRE-family HTH domain